METLAAGRSIGKIWLQPYQNNKLKDELSALAKRLGVPCSKVPAAKLRRLTKASHQGAVAFLSPICFVPLAETLQRVYEQGEAPLVLLLDQVTDVRNLGAIARTALSAGAHLLITPFHGGALINGEAMKSSAGALAHLPVCRVKRLSTALDYLKKSGLQVIACTEKASSSLYKADLTGPTALLVGGEALGIQQAHVAYADSCCCIPMRGPVASLNASVATTVFLYESLRQRQQEGP